MAKLSAYGGQVLAKWAREEGPVPEEDWYDIVAHRTKWAFVVRPSRPKVLYIYRQTGTQFRERDGLRWHSSPWHQHTVVRLKPEGDVARVVTRYGASLEAHGFQPEKVGP